MKKTNEMMEGTDKRNFEKDFKKDDYIQFKNCEVITLSEKAFDKLQEILDKENDESI